MKRSPEERRVERQSRDQNPFKPTFTKAPKDKPKAPMTTLQRRTRIRAGKGTLKQSRPLIDRHVKRQGQKFWVTGGQRQISKKKRKPLALHSNTPAARERRRLDRIWSEKVKAIWGSCIVTGYTGDGYWPLDSHHCYDKSIRPQWRHELWNGLPLRRDIHGNVDEWPEFHEACQKVADECKAAAEGRRPMPTRAEARQILFDHCPKLRQYARPE